MTAESQPTAILVMSPASYRGNRFVEAAQRLGLRALTAVDLPPELAHEWQVPLAVDLRRPEQSAADLASLAKELGAAAILSVDDSATVLAARAAALARLPHNDPRSAAATRNKLLMRELFREAGVDTPGFIAVPADSDPARLAADIEYPCVVKPLSMSGSRGVIRANDVAEFVQAFIRTRSIVLSETQDPATAQILIEQYRPGFEVALDGILTDGNLRVLVLFDKPDPLEGPFFEETIYTTPSRLPAEVQARIAAETERAARALGLTTGPIHAELRVHNGQPWVVEIAGRSIGGLCSTVLEFGSNLALEDVILRHAVGLPYEDLLQPASPAGVMMIPIPARGILKTVHGVEEARAVPGVQGVEITAKVNYPLVPLPEGASYLGFIFAKGTDAADAERALREAHGRLRFEIRPELPLVNAGFRPRLEN